MARIYLNNIQHSYNPNDKVVDYALKHINCEWQDGKAYALLGSSGCGKTTLLNIISGLLQPSEGRIVFDDNDVTNLTTEMRNVAQVFQFPVVYDTMSVFDNIAFPLRNRGVDEQQVKKRTQEVLEILEIQPFAYQTARGLGADVKQKISLGRGIVRNDVNALLFDEPLTVIDPHKKWQLRSQLKKLHQSQSHTMIYVTHDQVEALTFADEVVVMSEGEILQTGTPEALFECPQHTFVGYFIGSPGMNILPAQITDGGLQCGGHHIELASPLVSADINGRIELGIRPEYIRFAEDGMAVDIVKVEDRGRSQTVRVMLGDYALSIVLIGHQRIPSTPRIIFDKKAVHVYADGWRIKQQMDDKYYGQ